MCVVYALIVKYMRSETVSMRHFASNFALVNAPERVNFFIAIVT